MPSKKAWLRGVLDDAKAARARFPAWARYELMNKPTDKPKVSDTPKTTDGRSVDDVFDMAGFKYPAIRYVRKPDPRGSEYGEFRAFSVSHEAGGSIWVEKWMPDATLPLYKMTFNTLEDFYVWSREEF